MAQYEITPQLLTDNLQGEERLGITGQTLAAIAGVLEANADGDSNVNYAEASTLEDALALLEGPPPDYLQISASLIMAAAEASPDMLRDLAQVPVLVIRGEVDAEVGVIIEEVLAPALGEDRVVIGSDQSDLITYVSNNPQGDDTADRDDGVVEDAFDGNLILDLGGGDDTVETASGSDSITGGAGDDSIMSGAGADSIATGVGKDTIDAGEGIDFVSFSAGLQDIDILVDDDGFVTVRNIGTGELAATRNADYIELSDGTAIITAADQGDATAGRLVSSTVGEYDYDDYVSAFELDDSADNIDLVQFAEQLLAETDLDELSDTDFIETLYQGTFGRTVDDEGMAFYLDQLETGGKTRAEVFADLGWSEEGTEHFGFVVNIIDGTV